MGKIKTDTVEFTTQRSLKDLTAALRRAVNATKAQVEQLEDDPLEMVDDIKPQVAVLLSGSNFMGGSRMWGVQVILYDLGDRRAAQLVAIGEGFGAGVMSYYTGGYFELRDGKRRRDKILAILTENDPSAQKGISLEDEAEETPLSYADLTAAPAAVSGASPAGGAAGSASGVRASASPDGVDPNASFLFQKMQQNRAAVADFTQEQMDNVAYKLFALDCEKFADLHPDFPARSELKLIRALETEEGTQDRYLYQPYLDLFPEQNEAMARGINAIKSWAGSHSDDAFAALLCAGISEITDDHEAANQSLYRVLVLESRGANVNDLLVNWVQTAWASGFENWYYQRFGAVNSASRSVSQPASTAPVSMGGAAPVQPVARSANKAPVQPNNTGARHAAATPASLFQSLKTNAQGYKIVFFTAIAAIVLILLAVLSRFTSLLSLAAPVLWLVLVLFDQRPDSIPMAIPVTILALLSLLNGFSGGILSILSTLLIVAIAVLYWLLVLKKGLPQIQSARLLVLLLGIRTLLVFVNALGVLRYSFLLTLGTLGSCALMLSIAAAIYYASRDSILPNSK
ncbi:MAG: hypothetical protein IKF48_01910 [Oscillospiraceae bacterium]|nr:hypothetical protein [Oscillospiraceae bacterium]